eukprot:5949539-Amphidinium_carterae.1
MPPNPPHSNCLACKLHSSLLFGTHSVPLWEGNSSAPDKLGKLCCCGFNNSCVVSIGIAVEQLAMSSGCCQLGANDSLPRVARLTQKKA